MKMEAAKSQQHNYVRSILDHIEEFQKDPREELWQVAVPVSSWATVAEVEVLSTPDADAYITFPKPHHVPHFDLQLSAKQPSQDGQERELVHRALENPKFEWRTASGIANETGLEPETVAGALSQLKSQVVKSSRFTTDGQALYTTRSRYREFASIWRQLLGAIKNRVD
jgi:hypothetical protein